MNKYIFLNTFQNIKRSGWRPYAVIFMLTVTFLILGILMAVMFTSQSIADYFIKKPEVIGFFRDDVTELEILDFKRELETLPEVAEVRYVSKEQAMKNFLESNKDNQEVIEAVTINVFPAHLNVKANSLDGIFVVSDYFKSKQEVSDVLDSEYILGTLKKIVFGIQVFGTALLVIFSISTVFIIFLTIGITVYSQKQELIVMKLVGASDGFVRMPYLLQSVIYTILAALISSLILVPLIMLKYNDLLTLLVGDLNIRKIDTETVFMGFGFMLVFGFVLSFFSSYVATKRYINY